jgi:hypothetical protein
MAADFAAQNRRRGLKDQETDQGFYLTFPSPLLSSMKGSRSVKRTPGSVIVKSF